MITPTNWCCRWGCASIFSLDRAPAMSASLAVSTRQSPGCQLWPCPPGPPGPPLSSWPRTAPCQGSPLLGSLPLGRRQGRPTGQRLRAGVWVDSGLGGSGMIPVGMPHMARNARKGVPAGQSGPGWLPYVLPACQRLVLGRWLWHLCPREGRKGRPPREGARLRRLRRLLALALGLWGWGGNSILEFPSSPGVWPGVDAGGPGAKHTCHRQWGWRA